MRLAQFLEGESLRPRGGVSKKSETNLLKGVKPLKPKIRKKRKRKKKENPVAAGASHL